MMHQQTWDAGSDSCNALILCDHEMLVCKCHNFTSSSNALLPNILLHSMYCNVLGILISEQSTVQLAPSEQRRNMAIVREMSTAALSLGQRMTSQAGSQQGV